MYQFFSQTVALGFSKSFLLSISKFALDDFVYKRVKALFAGLNFPAPNTILLII